MARDKKAVEGEPVELLTVREVSQVTGVSRSTILFYVREEILPPPQRLANGRPIYGHIHVDLLEQVKRLKQQGKSLDEIRQALGNAGRSADFYQVDAAEAVQAATRSKILEAAADQFGQNGYNRTRLSDIIKQAGVAPQVFATFFPSKKELFAQSFGIASGRVAESAVSAMESESDALSKLLARFRNLLLSRMPDPSLWALARSEALYEGGEPASNVRHVYGQMSSLHVAELGRLRTRGSVPGPDVPDELIAYCFMGAEEYLIMRLGWDDEFSVDDAVKAYSMLISAVNACYGETPHGGE